MGVEPNGRRRAEPQRWELPRSSHAPAPAIIGELSRHLQLSETCARILARRGFTQLDAASRFMARRMDSLHDPASLPDIDLAVRRIAEAVDKGQRIVLFGDYDADGVTATATLARFFRVLKEQRRSNFTVEALVPERRDGYGLGKQALERIRALKPNLVITLDNGIAANEPVEVLNADGTDCIIVDHHHVGGELPRAHAVLNPQRHDGHTYPFRDLCGAGVTFKLAWALAVHFSQNKKVTREFREFLLDAMALVAIGTLADVVPLVDENRILAYHGLKALEKTRMPGLRALLDASNLANDLKPSDISFRLAPRLNAAGRCGQSAEALELLMTEDTRRAADLAEKLESYNIERQSIELKILEEARQQALDCIAKSPKCRGFVLGASGWHLGVIGIVASRIVEEFHRPAFLLSVNAESGMAQGSGRSIRGLHLYEALEMGKEHLVKFGGHAAAAGLTMDGSKIDLFRESFGRATTQLLTDEDMIPRLYVDEPIALEQLTMKLCSELEMFEPCGAGNPRPMLAAFDLSISGSPRLMGKEERHVSFFVKQGKAARRVVGFNCADRFNTLCDLQRGGLDLAFRPKISSFNNELELFLEAFRAPQGMDASHA